MAESIIIGRDKLIDRIWKRINKESLRFTAERRIGKTTVLTKMAAEPRAGWQVLFLDLEAVASPGAFAEKLLTSMKAFLSKRQKASSWLSGFIDSIGGTEIAGMVKLPEGKKADWRDTVEKLFEGVSSQPSEARLLLLFDEIPYMLQKISAYEKRSSSGTNYSLEILDSLREIREKHENIRMIFAGSVGLHHILSELRGDEFASQPVNNMDLVEIGPLELDDAVELAEKLFRLEEVDCGEADVRQLANRVVTLTDRVPFYLERIIARLAESEEPATLESVDALVSKFLTDDFDLWEMEHFRERLSIYYRGEITGADGTPIRQAAVAGAILDFLATAETAQSIDEVFAAVKARLPLPDREVVVHLLRWLTQDHYLISDTQKRYAYRFPLIRKWWVLAQGLGN